MHVYINSNINKDVSVRNEMYCTWRYENLDKDRQKHGANAPEAEIFLLWQLSEILIKNSYERASVCDSSPARDAFFAHPENPCVSKQTKGKRFRFFYFFKLPPSLPCISFADGNTKTNNPLSHLFMYFLGCNDIICF